MKSKITKTCLVFTLCTISSILFFSNDIHASESGRTYYASFTGHTYNGYDENDMWYAGPGTIRVRGRHWIASRGYREANINMQLRRDNWPFSVKYDKFFVGHINSNDNYNWSTGKPFDVSWEVGDSGKRYYLQVTSGSVDTNKVGYGTISYTSR